MEPVCPILSSKRPQDYAVYMLLCTWRKPLKDMGFSAVFCALIGIIWHAA
jgi:hypothetical protein